MGSAAELVEKRMKEIRDFHQSFEVKIGLGQLIAKNEVNRYLTISQAEIRKLSAEECGEAAVIICQEAAYLQGVINKAQAIVNWCERSITKSIAGEIDNVGGQYTPYKGNYRRELAIKQHEVATELDTAMRKSVIIVETLEYMPTRLRDLATMFEKLQQTKRGMRT